MLYCIKCSKEYPDDARFCSFCGKPLVTLEQAAGGLARILVTEISDFDQLAKDGSVTTNDVERAVKILETNRSAQLAQNSSLNYFALAKDIEYFFRQRWYSVEGKPQVNRKTVADDLPKYVMSGLEGLLKIYPNIDSERRRDLLYGYKGLAIWLEDEVIKHMLLAHRMAHIETTKDEMFLVSTHLGSERFGAIVDHVTGQMKLIKQ
jgi:hypothetical protein